jgi:RNA polymerase subunit RPABC4/transcription elongation factor Spt4
MSFAIKNGDSEQTVKCKSRLTTQQWKHVVVTIGKEKTAIYVDGEEEASETGITIRPSDIRPVLNYLGRSQSTSHPFLTADLDDVCIFNYAVTAEDVKEIMNGGTPSTIDETKKNPQKSLFYGIDGIKRDAPRRGLNIIDGKKVMK